MVNRGNAPDLYLGIVPITRDGSGLRLGGSGEVIEWAVHLRRFDENATLDRLATNGPFNAQLIDKLARAVVAAHRRAPLRDGYTATRTLRRLLQETIDELGAAADVFAPDQVVTFGAALVAQFDLAEPILLRRGERGQVRRCHGDLHRPDQPVRRDVAADRAVAETRLERFEHTTETVVPGRRRSCAALPRQPSPAQPSPARCATNARSSSGTNSEVRAPPPVGVAPILQYPPSAAARKRP